MLPVLKYMIDNNYLNLYKFFNGIKNIILSQAGNSFLHNLYLYTVSYLLYCIGGGKDSD